MCACDDSLNEEIGPSMILLIIECKVIIDIFEDIFQSLKKQLYLCIFKINSSVHNYPHKSNTSVSIGYNNQSTHAHLNFVLNVLLGKECLVFLHDINCPNII